MPKKQRPNPANVFGLNQDMPPRRGHVVRIHDAEQAEAHIFNGPLIHLTDGQLVLCTDVYKDALGHTAYSFNLLHELELPAVDLILHATFETHATPGWLEGEVSPYEFKALLHGDVGIIGHAESPLPGPRTGRLYTVRDEGFLKNAMIDAFELRPQIEKGTRILCTDMVNSKSPYEFMLMKRQGQGWRGLSDTFFHAGMDTEEWSIALRDHSEFITTHEFMELVEGRVSFDRDREQFPFLGEASPRH